MEKANTKATTKATASSELSKTSAVVIAFTAVTIGCWATASLFAGTISSSGGPLGLIQNFITAVTG
jgi:hypothetical protein